MSNENYNVQIAEACQDLFSQVSPEELTQDLCIMFDGFLSTDHAQDPEVRVSVNQTRKLLEGFFVSVAVAMPWEEVEHHPTT